MAAAHFLTELGANVTLFESSDQFGGLGTFFPYGHGYLERFYHCMLPGDTALLELLRFLEIEDRVYWRQAEFGFMIEGKLYGLNTALELLRFSALPMLDRLRIGLTAVYASTVSSKGLDDITSEVWLSKLCGRRAFDLFWKPLLQAKFGDRFHDVPALWFWTRFNREKGTRKEVKGYIRGGYKFLTDTLVASLRRRGAELLLDTTVQSLDLTEDELPVLKVHGKPRVFDRTVVTTPLFFLHRIAGQGGLRKWMENVDSTIDAQGVVNVVLLLRRGLTRFYWVAAIDGDVPFQGIVESSVLLRPEDTGGYHLVYLMNYVHRSHPLFKRTDRDIIDEYLGGLKRMFAGFRDSDVVDSFVFRAPFVEPLYTTGYLTRRPPHELVPGRVYLATSAQVYPQVTSWNGATALAKSVVMHLHQRAHLLPRHSKLARVAAV